MNRTQEPAENPVYIGVGSNLGNAIQNVRQAIDLLDRLPMTRLDAQSSLFRTSPIDASGDDYINAVARIQTRLEPELLLHELQNIEQTFGRERPYRNAPRTLDLDVLLYGQRQIQTDLLSIPHPRLTQRAFALIPLLQIDPFIMIPGAGPAHAFAAAVPGQAIKRL